MTEETGQLAPQVTRAYPGTLATSAQILNLATEYRRAAHVLLEQRQGRSPLSLAPCRLSAIHAIELYLNALLLHFSRDPAMVRGLQHDLSARLELAIKGGLVLRKRTHLHLSTLHSNREYLIVRYSPEETATVSQMNRLMATLNEIATKVVVKIGGQQDRLSLMQRSHAALRPATQSPCNDGSTFKV